MKVDGTQAPGSEEAVLFRSVVSNVLTANSGAYQGKLAAVSSSFQEEFAYAASVGKQNVSSEARSTGASNSALKTGTIVGALICGLILRVIAALVISR